MRLTSGTSTNPASMANAPQLMGDWRTDGKRDGQKRFSVITPAPKRKLTHTAARVVRFQ